MEFGRVEGEYPGFYVVRDDGLRLEVCQVSPENIAGVLEARGEIGSGWNEYAQGENPNYGLIAHRSPFQHGDLGRLYMAIVVGGEVVGLSNHDYFDEDELRKVTGGLVIVNRLRRLGYGTLYLSLSSHIAREMGAFAFVGLTQSGTLLRARLAMGWRVTGKVTSFGGVLTRIEKRL